MNIIVNIFKNLFSRPATRMYPFVVRAEVEKAKGHIEIDINACIFCGMCVRKCPANSLVVEKDKKSWQINPFSCIVCGACVDACPKKCLYMNSQKSYPVRNPDARINNSNLNS